MIIKKILFADYTDILMLVLISARVTTNKELSRLLKISRAAVTQRATKMEKLGFLKIIGTETKHNKTAYVLTQKGQKNLRENLRSVRLT